MLNDSMNFWNTRVTQAVQMLGLFPKTIKDGRKLGKVSVEYL
jgi:hypothetical protein